MHCYRDATYCSMRCIEQAVINDNNYSLYSLIRSAQSYPIINMIEPPKTCDQSYEPPKTCDQSQSYEPTILPDVNVNDCIYAKDSDGVYETDVLANSDSPTLFALIYQYISNL